MKLRPCFHVSFSATISLGALSLKAREKSKGSYNNKTRIPWKKWQLCWFQKTQAICKILTVKNFFPAVAEAVVRRCSTKQLFLKIDRCFPVKFAKFLRTKKKKLFQPPPRTPPAVELFTPFPPQLKELFNLP